LTSSRSPRGAGSPACPADGNLHRVTEIGTLAELINVPETEPKFTHLWVVCTVCRFPLVQLCRTRVRSRALRSEDCHAALGIDLLERIGSISPRPMVRAYRWNGATVPLLRWYRNWPGAGRAASPRARFARVISIIQEYLHIVYSYIPEVRVPGGAVGRHHHTRGTTASCPTEAPPSSLPTVSGRRASCRRGTTSSGLCSMNPPTPRGVPAAVRPAGNPTSSRRSTSSRYTAVAWCATPTGATCTPRTATTTAGPP
jgi:hypothetical protein